MTLKGTDILRASGFPGVLSIEAFARALEAKLKEKGQLDRRLTAAGFAVQMVDAAGQFLFEIGAD